MRVFIGWSRQCSREVAQALRDWLKKVIQAIEPWMSDEDIEKGARWNDKIAHVLGDSHFGIICLTPENKDAPWINFEAGTISKVVNDSHLCPYLFRMRPQDISGPLAQFQATPADREGTKRLLETINSHPKLERALSPKDLDQSFDIWWPKLKEQFDSIIVPTRTEAPVRSSDELLGGVLETVRAIKREREGKDETLIADGLRFRDQQRNQEDALKAMLGRTQDETQRLARENEAIRDAVKKLLDKAAEAQVVKKQDSARYTGNY